MRRSHEPTVAGHEYAWLDWQERRVDTVLDALVSELCQV
jgi:hypothetical protein